MVAALVAARKRRYVQKFKKPEKKFKRQFLASLYFDKT